MTPLNMQSEPIRLPAWAVAVLLVVGPPLATVLQGGDVKQAIATAILGLVAGGGVIAVAESKRARTDSPATIERRVQELAAVPLPGEQGYSTGGIVQADGTFLPLDERSGCDGG